MTSDTFEPPPKPSEDEGVDWTDGVACLLTFAVTLMAYLLKLAPDVTLENSGTYATAAVYAGVGQPSGYPLWTVYAWLFTKLPFGNIAWRVALSSAVAGAGLAAMVAWLVSRMSVELFENFRAENFQRRRGTDLSHSSRLL